MATAPTTANLTIGQRVQDAFGIWFLDQDRDGNWSARQRGTEVLLLDHTDFARFGIVA